VSDFDDGYGDPNDTTFSAQDYADATAEGVQSYQDSQNQQFGMGSGNDSATGNAGNFTIGRDPNNLTNFIGPLSGINSVPNVFNLGGGVGDFAFGNNQSPYTTIGNKFTPGGAERVPTFLNPKLAEMYKQQEIARTGVDLDKNPYVDSIFTDLFGDSIDRTKDLGSRRVQEINDLRARQAFGLPSLTQKNRDGSPASYTSRDFEAGRDTNQGIVKQLPMGMAESLFQAYSPFGALMPNKAAPERSQIYKQAMVEENAPGIMSEIGETLISAKDSFLDFFNKPDAGLNVKQVLSSEQRGKELSEFPQFQRNTGTLPVASPINNVTKTELPNNALASFPELPTQSNRDRAMLSRDILASMNVDNKGILALPQARPDLINEDGFNTITGEFVPSAFSNVPESFKEDLDNIEISAGPANGTKLSPEKEKKNRSYQVYNQIKQLEELQNAIFTNRQDVLPKEIQSSGNPKLTNKDVDTLNKYAAEIATLELLQQDIRKTEPKERFDSSRVNLVPDITGEGFVLENKYRDSTFTPEEIKEMRLQGFQFDDFPTKTNVSVSQLPPYLQKEYYLNTNLDYGKPASTPLNVVY
jgi:hypothetical protein